MKCSNPKNCRVISIAIFACVVTLLPYFYHFTSLTVSQNLVEKFINGSVFDHYGFYLTETQLSALFATISSINFLASLFGALISAYLCDRFGRKPVLFLVNPVLNILGSLCQGFALPLDIFELLFIGRIFSGLSGGIGVVAFGVYLAEIAPSNLRASLGSLANVAGGVGIFIPLVLGLPSILGTFDRLPILLLFPAAAGIVAILTSKLVPESPRFNCMIRDNVVASKKSITQLGTTDEAEIDKLLLEYRSEVSYADSEQSNFRAAFSVPFYRSTMLLIALIGISNGVTAFHCLETYATEFLTHAGLDRHQSQIMASVVGLVDVLAAIPSPIWPDKFGRRKCLIGSLFITLLMQICMCIFVNLSTSGDEKLWTGYATTACLLVVVIVYSCGPGTVCSIVAPEIAPIQIRSVASSAAQVSRSISNFVSVWCFYPLLTSFGGYAFLPFILLIAVCVVLLAIYLPETRSLSVHEAVAKWERKASSGARLNLLSSGAQKKDLVRE